MSINGATSVFCDDESVVKNTTGPESPTKKKHNSVAHHRAREVCASDTVGITKKDRKTCIANLFTKTLDGNHLRDLCRRCARGPTASQQEKNDGRCVWTDCVPKDKEKK